ncbi:hypothetical protein J4E08_20790 [Sagittula sp. NFXS13]|uniref:calcium-binding protein n=1 Tax=Sagittula sp. NFXS13 TaxID=2819095 RepID=UPI0032DE8369
MVALRQLRRGTGVAGEDPLLGRCMAYVFLNANQIYTGSYYPVANGDTVYVTDGTIIANDENYTVIMSGGSARSLLVNYGQIIGHGFATLYMGAANSVLENHGLLRNNDDSLNMRPAVLLPTAGNHRIVNNGEITSAGRVIDVNGAAATLSYTVQNHGLMQALYGHDLLRDGDYASHVTVENTGTMRGGELAMSGTGRSWLDNSGFMEVTNIDGASTLGLKLFNTGVIQGFESSKAFLADAGEVWIQGSEDSDLVRNQGTIRGDMDAASGGDAIYNSGHWVGDLTLGFGNDSIYGFDGTFEGIIDAGPGDDRIALAENNATVIGGEGQDTLIARGDVLNVSGVEVIVLQGYGSYEVIGSEAGDDIRGNYADNSLSGLGGADTISGGAGNDVIFGGDADDVLYGNAGDDEIDGGANADVLVGGEGNDTLRGDVGNDALSGGNGNDYVDGGINDDTMTGGFGDDTLLGGDGGDYIAGLGDDDYLDAGNGADRVLGGDGDDTLIGGAGNDTIAGDGGNDVIQGGLGYDILIGKSGSDTFVFDSFAEVDDGTPDRIKDFERGRDIIDLSGIDEEASFRFAGTGGFTGSGGMEVFYFVNPFGATLLYLDENGDGATDASLILLNVPDGVTEADFIL